MPGGGGITLIVIGAIMTFALTEHVRGVDLHIVGVILMLAGVVGVMLSLIARGRSAADEPARDLHDHFDHGDGRE